jgi:hypothetical protein
MAPRKKKDAESYFFRRIDLQSEGMIIRIRSSGPYYAMEDNNILIHGPDHLQIKANGFDSSYTRGFQSKTKVAAGLHPITAHTQSTKCCECASADEAELLYLRPKLSW